MELLPPRPLRTEDLPALEAWFDDPETRRWLGGREWPRGLLELARAPDRFALLFAQREDPVALLDLERYGDGTAAIAIVVAPTRRHEGVGRTVLQSLFALPETQVVVEIIGEVEHENATSHRLLRAAGFAPDANGRGDEGFDRYLLNRAPQ